MNINGASHQLTRVELGDAYLLVNGPVDLTFDSADWPDEPIMWTDGSDRDFYIPPLPNGQQHVLPANAAIPILRRVEAWALPSEAQFQAVRNIIEMTSNMGVIEEPGYERFKRLRQHHLGGPQLDIGGKEVAKFKDTRIQWWRDNYADSLGGTRKRGWYFGTIEGRDANGISNKHYNRLLWMTMALIYETDHEKRLAAWEFYVQQSVSYYAFGRIQNGAQKGYSRTEKGDVYVGRDSRGIDGTAYEKDWVPNLVGPWLLTGQQMFAQALRDAADFYSAITYRWGGAWGARIPGRILENMLQLWMVLPEFRWALEREMGVVLDILSAHLDRNEWFWLNMGNNGKGPMSGWMQLEAVASNLRVHEHVPSLRNRGLTRVECVNVAKRVMDTTRGVEGGSEMVGGYACLRYRFHTTTGEPMTARFLGNTAFALPALRLLEPEMPHEYANCRELLQRFAGSSIADVAAGSPRPIEEIGYRDPTRGPAAPKDDLEYLEALR